jgi:hypothetical protein
MKAAFAVVAMLALMAACGANPAVHQGTGVVTGGIMPCSGLAPSMDPNLPHYAAGTVTVLKGKVTWQTTGPGVKQAVFPTTVVASERVSTNQRYSFTLAPGDYVLRARFLSPGNVVPWTSLTVQGGRTVRRDVPNMCK